MTDIMSGVCFKKKDEVKKGYWGMLYEGGVAGGVKFKRGCQEGQ